MYLNKLYVYAVDFSCFVFILIVRHDVMMERSRKVFTLYRLQKYKKQMRRRTFHCTKFGDYMKKVNLSQKTMFFITEERVWIKEDILERKNSITYITSRLFWFCRRKAIRLLLSTYCFFEIDLAKNPSPFIYSLESPVFIGVSGVEWLKSTLHHPSSPVISCHSNCFQFVMNSLP